MLCRRIGTDYHRRSTVIHSGEGELDDRLREVSLRQVFANSFTDEEAPPREWAERLYDVRRWSTMPRGHFAPAEEPEVLARDFAVFFGDLQTRP
jgi:hypothetical protein